MLFSTALFLATVAYSYPADTVGAAAPAGITLKEYPLAGTQLKLGIALPSTPTGKNDFIGQLTGTGIGWGGISLGPSMVNYVLIVAEPDGTGSAKGSLHKATARMSPPLLSDPSITLTTITGQAAPPPGSWQYTFLCSGCLAAGSANFTQAGAGGSIGFAYSSQSTKLSPHDRPGIIPLTGLAEAKTAGYAAIAASAQQ